MRPCPVEQRHIESDPTPRQPLPDRLRDFSRPGRYFQQGKMSYPGNLSHAFHHLLRSGNPTEPAVDPAEIPQRSLYVGGRTSVGIKNLRCVDSLHGRAVGCCAAFALQTSASSSSSNCLLYRSL